MITGKIRTIEQPVIYLIKGGKLIANDATIWKYITTSETNFHYISQGTNYVQISQSNTYHKDLLQSMSQNKTLFVNGKVDYFGNRSNYNAIVDVVMTAPNGTSKTIVNINTDSVVSITYNKENIKLKNSHLIEQQMTVNGTLQESQAYQVHMGMRFYGDLIVKATSLH